MTGASCDGSGPPSCGICGSLTARQSECDGRLYGASLTGRLDLGVEFNAWMFLRVGPDSVLGMTWDDFLSARSTAIRMLQARARVAPHDVIAAAEAALALAEGALENECATSPAGEDAFAALASIRDSLRTGLQPLHAADQAAAA